ncbi:MAG: acyl-ACP thioesterase domain-containing protein [Ktedonobacterales bacterium]
MSNVISNNRALAIPGEAFHDQLRVRSYEVGRSGVIGLGTALRYCESLATDASAAIGFDRSWYVNHHTAWVVREMTILMGARPQIGQELRLATWVSEFRRVQAQREYAIWCPSTGKLVARASARWAYCDTVRGQLTRISDEILAAMKAAGNGMAIRRPRSLAGVPPATEGFSTLLLQARHYETDSQQHINNCVYADWLDEAFHQAAVSVAPPTEMPVVRHVEHLRPRFYHIEYIREVVAGDALCIETRTAPRGSRVVAADQSILHPVSNTTTLRAYSEHIRQLR